MSTLVALVVAFAWPAPAGTMVAARPGWDWPLAGTPAVVRPFDPPAAPWSPGHRGVDLAAEPGDTVVAPGPGVVAFAGMVAGRGVVSVDHPGGLRTTYEPVVATVQAGDPVGLATPLGTLEAGHPGCAAPACLHWGLRRGTTYLNPLLLLRPLRVRLKPLALAEATATSMIVEVVDCPPRAGRKVPEVCDLGPVRWLGASKGVLAPAGVPGVSGQLCALTSTDSGM